MQGVNLHNLLDQANHTVVRSAVACTHCMLSLCFQQANNIAVALSCQLTQIAHYHWSGALGTLINTVCGTGLWWHVPCRWHLCPGLPLMQYCNVDRPLINGSYNCLPGRSMTAQPSWTAIAVLARLAVGHRQYTISTAAANINSQLICTQPRRNNFMLVPTIARGANYWL